MRGDEPGSSASSRLLPSCHRVSAVNKTRKPCCSHRAICLKQRAHEQRQLVFQTTALLPCVLNCKRQRRIDRQSACPLHAGAAPAGAQQGASGPTAGYSGRAAGTHQWHVLAHDAADFALHDVPHAQLVHREAHRGRDQRRRERDPHDRARPHLAARRAGRAQRGIQRVLRACNQGRGLSRVGSHLPAPTTAASSPACASKGAVSMHKVLSGRERGPTEQGP